MLNQNFLLFILLFINYSFIIFAENGSYIPMSTGMAQDGRVWALERKVFQQIMVSTGRRCNKPSLQGDI